MEPILPEPTAEGNNIPQGRESSVQSFGVPAGNPEAAPNVAPERPHESSATPAPAAPAALPPQPQQQTNPQPVRVSSAPSPTAQASDDPLIADDVDVIEKEWVDKAKKIVNATKEDPHEQEKEVSKLQADYLMKRYNKQIKLSE